MRAVVQDNAEGKQIDPLRELEFEPEKRLKAEDESSGESDSDSVDPLLPTRESLLSRLREGTAHESWREFFETYWRLLYNNARRAGLSDSEAQEVVQETMVALTARLPAFRYDPARCSFKTWLLQLTRWKIGDQFRKREKWNRQREIALSQVADSLDKSWDEDWQLNVAEEALRRVGNRANPRLLQAFSLHVMEGRTARETAQLLRMTTAAVCVAAFRINRLIRKEALKIDKGDV